MKTNNYNIERIIDLLSNRGYTNFLNPKDLMLVKGKLHKSEYKIYELYEDSNKVILYKKEIPKIKLYKINSEIDLRHQEILGTIFSLGINEDMFGDIVKYQGDYYIFLESTLEKYIKYNLIEIKNSKVFLEEVDLDIKDNFKQEYNKKEYIVTSLRIDNIVSTITNSSRNQVLEKFKNNEIILNYQEEIKPTRILKEGDIFSIRKYGKFKFSQILKETKKGSLIIEILEYK